MSNWNGWFPEEKRRALGDRLACGAVMVYESGGGGAVELEFVVLDRNQAFMVPAVFIHAPNVLYGGAMNFTASKIVLREQSQAGQSTGDQGGGPNQAHIRTKHTQTGYFLSCVLGDPVAKILGLANLGQCRGRKHHGIPDVEFVAGKLQARGRDCCGTARPN